MLHQDEYEDDVSSDEDMDEDWSIGARRSIHLAADQDIYPEQAGADDTSDANYVDPDDEDADEVSATPDDAMDVEHSEEDSDEPGSDWDSDEELSGDEDALVEAARYRARQWLPHGFPQAS